MMGNGMLAAALVLLLLIGATPAPGAAADAPNHAPVLSRPVMIKGFVTDATVHAISVLQGDGLRFRVTATAATTVTGMRDSFAGIAVNDLVTVEGTEGPERSVAAERIEVLLVGDGVRMNTPRPSSFASFFWNWMLHGGPTLPLR